MRDGNWTGTARRVRHDWNEMGQAWVLLRNHGSASDQEAFNGPGTAAPAFSGDLADPTQPIEISIVLNTEAPVWTATYFLNGVQQGGIFSLPEANDDDVGEALVNDIAAVGFSRIRGAGTTPTCPEYGPFGPRFSRAGVATKTSIVGYREVLIDQRYHGVERWRPTGGTTAGAGAR